MRKFLQGDGDRQSLKQGWPAAHGGITIAQLPNAAHGKDEKQSWSLKFLWYFTHESHHEKELYIMYKYVQIGFEMMMMMVVMMVMVMVPTAIPCH